MNCETMLMQLLEAEPNELRGMADTPLTRHLRTCPRCMAVAERLVLDTAQLAFAVRAEQGRAELARRRSSRWWLLPVGAMTAVALLLWRGREQPPAQAVPVTASVITPSASPAIATPMVAAQTTRSRAVAPDPAPPGLRRLRVQPVPQVVAYQVEAIVVAPLPAPEPVSVTPILQVVQGGDIAPRPGDAVQGQPTSRATVLRSTVPGVTVIWSNK